MRALFIFVVTALAAAGCSILDTVNTLSSESGSSSVGDIAYGPHPRQRLDLYRPDKPGSDSAIIVFFYGGAWASGERSEYEFVARSLATLGHYVVVPDYRLYPEVTFPDFVYDGADATAYVMRNMTELAGVTRPLFLAGHSAGAHIAMLLAVDPRYLARVGRARSELAGVIGLAGPYDFLPLESDSLKRIFPTPETRRDSQPVNFVDAGQPPVFLAHGDRDERVWLRNSLNMTEKLESAGNSVTLKIYPGFDHTDLIKPFVSFIDDDAGILRDIEAFISAQAAKN